MCLFAICVSLEKYLFGSLSFFNWVVCLIVVNHIYSKGMCTSPLGVVSGARFVDCQALVSCGASLGPVPAALMLPLPASLYRPWLDDSGPQEHLGVAPQGCLVLGPCTEDVLRACPLGVSLATCKSRRQRGGWAPAVFPPSSVTWRKPVRRQLGSLSRGVEALKDAGGCHCPGLWRGGVGTLAIPLCEDTGPVLAPEGAQVAEMVRETQEGLNQEANPFFAPENCQIKPRQVSSSPCAALETQPWGWASRDRGPVPLPLLLRPLWTPCPLKQLCFLLAALLRSDQHAMSASKCEALVSLGLCTTFAQTKTVNMLVIPQFSSLWPPASPKY